MEPARQRSNGVGCTNDLHIVFSFFQKLVESSKIPCNDACFPPVVSLLGSLTVKKITTPRASPGMPAI